MASPLSVTLNASSSRWFVHGWSRDGSRLYGLKPDERNRLALVSFEVRSKQEITIGELGPLSPVFALTARKATSPFRGFSLAPDGKSFLTSIYRAKSDLWLLELQE